MKKLAVALFVALIGFAFTAPAFAVENTFGGYWRVRMFKNKDFSGRESDSSKDLQVADTRTRLYYTAKINDDLKFVNKFEMDADWGDKSSYGDIGADSVSVEVKNSYVDFNYLGANWKMGTQGGVIQRGFILDDDFSGITMSAGGFTGLYAKVEENGDSVSDDVQAYHARYAFKLGNAMVVPNLTYTDGVSGDSKGTSEDNMWYLGLDVDGAAGACDYWATLIYNGGEVSDDDVSAFLFALGGSVALNKEFSLHGEFFHATGDDDNDGDRDDFQAFDGASYYWSEIMGLGVFDDQGSNGSPEDALTNISAFNLGIKYQATEDLTLGADLWYALLAEDDANGEDELGTEIDLSLAYTIIPGMRLHAVAAYLFAGDATTGKASDDENPYELGTQFSISF